MSRKGRAGQGPEVTQTEPTAPPPRDAAGLELDQWGLPIIGPARVKRLAELGKPDPNIDPSWWGAGAADAAAPASVEDMAPSDVTPAAEGGSDND